MKDAWILRLIRIASVATSRSISGFCFMKSCRLGSRSFAGRAPIVGCLRELNMFSHGSSFTGLLEVPNASWRREISFIFTAELKRALPLAGHAEQDWWTAAALHWVWRPSSDMDCTVRTICHATRTACASEGVVGVAALVLPHRIVESFP